MAVQLFGTWISPYVLRIKWALMLKGVEYEYVEEDLANKSEILLKYNPVHKKVPVLVHNGRPICESLVILEYIEETWKENAILPKDPYGKAMAHFYSKFGDDKCVKSIWGVFLSQGRNQEEGIALVRENLKILEEVLDGKKFFAGGTIGFLDISLGWLAYVVAILEEIIELKMIDKETFPSLSAWTKNFTNSLTIKDSFPPRDKMISAFRAIRGASSFASQETN